MPSLKTATQALLQQQEVKDLWNIWFIYLSAMKTLLNERILCYHMGIRSRENPPPICHVICLIAKLSICYRENLLLNPLPFVMWSAYPIRFGSGFGSGFLTLANLIGSDRSHDKWERIQERILLGADSLGSRFLTLANLIGSDRSHDKWEQIRERILLGADSGGDFWASDWIGRSVTSNDRRERILRWLRIRSQIRSREKCWNL